ncbi:MAG TPA: efflux RND transporter permease subunit, partial [Steroidobacteraceae bacterium]|nr:efflux RND transporter permease subunit [Steroidobacteraceae bacterium]
MNINFSAWSIHRPLPAILGFTLVTIAGLFAFKALPVADFADIEFPVVTISVSYPGATPTQMESEITRKVENAVANVSMVEHIRSNISEGSSLTQIEFSLDKNIYVAVDDVRDAVTRIRSQLPQEINEPIIARVEMAGQSLQTFAVTSDSMTPAEMSWFVDDTVTRDLSSVSGVGSVARVGGVAREVRVDLLADRMLSFGVTAAEISSQLRRIHADRAGGRSTFAGGEQAIRTISTVDGATELRALPIVLNDGRRVRLDELARVEDRYAEQRQLAFLDGKPVVGFQVSRATGADAVRIAHDTRDVIAKLNAKNSTLTIHEVVNSVDAVEDNYTSSMHMLYEGGILAMIVVFFFLRDWRATWISAIALPLSVIPTFWIMNLAGYSLNTITLLALTLVVGILVDDAIVEIENIVRHLREGKSPKQAALDAAEEIGLAVIATSLTLVAVFLPVAFMPGIPGRMFKQFALTAVTAVVFSLIVARLLTPMIAAFKLKDFQHEHKDGPITVWYMNVVTWSMKHRRTTMLSAALLFIIPMGALMFVPAGFMPAEDRDQLSVGVELPPGGNITDTQHVLDQMNAIAKRHPEVTAVFAVAGSGNMVSNANATILLKSRHDRDLAQSEVQAVLQEEFKAIPAARFSFMSGFGGGDRLQLILSGDDSVLLEQTVERIERDIRGIPGVGAIKSSAALTRPEIRVVPDLQRAAELGITSDTISEAIRIGTTGDVDFRLAKLDLPSRQIPIRVQLEESARNNMDFLRLLRVPTRQGSVPLDSVATATLSSGPAQITHYDRSRDVTLDVDLNGRQLGEMTKLVDNLPSVQKLPPGVQRVAGGNSRQMNEMFTGFIVAMALGVFCVYAVLVLLFNDVMQPLTILIALPMSLGGAVGALLLFGYSLAVPSLIGLLMLMGIAVKNSILLVDYAVLGERRGL